MMFEDSEGVLEENWVGAEFREEETESGDDRHGSPEE